MCILPAVGYFVKQRLRNRIGQCRDALVRVPALVRVRYLVVFNLWMGRTARQTSHVLHVHYTTVCRVAAKFRLRGEASLWDGRENNGFKKLSEHYLSVLDRLVRASPEDHGWTRPT